MAEIDYNTVIAAMRKGDPGSPGAPGAPGIGWAGTALGTSNLNDILTPGVYFQNNGVNATVERNYPSTTVGASLVVEQYAGTGGVIQTFKAFGNGGDNATYGTYIRSLRSAVWSNWRAYALQRVVNVADTKAIYTWDETTKAEQLIYGDTGWLDVAPIMETDWLPTSAIMRRVNNLVTVNIEGIKNAVPPNANPSFFKPPVGFKPEVMLNNSMGNQRYGILTDLAGANARVVSPENGGAGLRLLSYTAALVLHGSISYYTRDPWPTATPTPIAGTPGKPM